MFKHCLRTNDFWFTSKGHKSHFSLKETKCPCGCGKNEMSQDVINVIEKLRCLIAKPIYITSAFRCSSWNAKVGGADSSYHTKGQAIDFVVFKNDKDFYSSFELFSMIKGFRWIPSLIYYSDSHKFVHLDTREVSAPLRLFKFQNEYFPVELDTFGI